MGDRFTLQAERYWLSRHRLHADVRALLDGAAVFADVLKLDDAAERSAFVTATQARLNGAAVPGDEIEHKLLALAEQVPTALDAAEKAGGRETIADKLLSLVEATELFHDPQDDCYARIDVDGHAECWPIRSKGFRRWLVGRYYAAHASAPNAEAIANALGVIEARAQFDGPCWPVYLRVAPDGQGGQYFDLGNPDWQAVHVTANGWRVVVDPPVRFLRSPGLLPLPLPVAGGSLDDLRTFVNVPDDDSWTLIKAWLVAAARDTGPYPVLALYGEQGSAKTTLARMLRALLDPAIPDLRSDPREIRDLMIAARHCWLVGFDNVSSVPSWLSDALCRLATSGGWATRELYSDFDEARFAAQRPVLLNGITEFIRRGDLLDRTIQIVLPAIPDRGRRDERQLWADFEAARPRLLGALLDSVVGALRELPATRLDGLPRMADFALWAVAAERGRAEPPRFLRAYAGARVSAHEQAIEASGIGQALRRLLDDLPRGDEWAGTASDLLDELAAWAPEGRSKSRDWPKSARGLSSELRRLAPALRALGYFVELDRREGHVRRRVIALAKPDRSPDDPDVGDTGDEPAAARESEQPAAPAAPTATESAGRTDGVVPPIEEFGDAGGSVKTRTVADDCGRLPGTSGPLPSADRPQADGVRQPAEGDTAGADDAAGSSGHVSASAGTAGLDAMTLIETSADLEAALPVLLAAPMIGLDTETTGLDPRVGRLRLVQLATMDRVYLVDCGRLDPRALAPILERARLIGHNLKFDLAFLAATGLPVPHGDRLFDTQIVTQLLGAGSADGYLNRCGLAAVADRYLGRTLDKALQASDWSGDLSSEQLAYAARDAAILLPLAAQLEVEIARADLGRVAGIEMRCLPALVWLETTGAPFDANAWADLSDAAVAEQIRLEAVLTAEAGTGDFFGKSTVDWASPKQVAKLLRERGHTVTNTDEATLAALVGREPLAGLLLQYREAARKATAYGIEFLKNVHDATGRIHADYLQLGSRAGRMSCQRPNLQQVPRDKAYRACFRPAEGRVLVKADYSQIELRIAAEITGDARLIAAFEAGEDLHTATARALLGRAGVTPTDRQIAKAVNFGLIYGMGATRLVEHAATGYGVTLTPAEANRLRARFFATYRRIRHWHQRQPDGPVETRTLAGRRRLQVSRFTEKLNSPIQGTGADGLKAALALLWERRAECPDAVPILTVHDEIVIECDAATADRAASWLVAALKDGMQPLLARVPVDCEATIAADWAGTPFPAVRSGGNAL